MDRNVKVASSQLTDPPAISGSEALDQGSTYIARLADISLSGREKFVEDINVDRYNALRLRNSLFPFHQIPPEIHAYILRLSPARDWREHYRQLHTYARVSCLWKSAVLNAPILWSRISSDMDPQLCATALARSKNCPLTVELSMFYVKADVFSLIIQAVQRWGSINVHWDAYRDSRSLKSVLEQPMPHLRRAILQPYRASSPINLGAGQEGSLKELFILGVADPWDSRILLGLKSLKMCRTGDHAPTWPQLHNLLRNAAHLELLSMVESMNISDLSSALRPGAPITLPSFQSLTLERVPTFLLRNILEAFHLPNLETCDINLNMKWGTSRDTFTSATAHMLPIFGAMVNASDGVSIRLNDVKCEIKTVTVVSDEVSSPQELLKIVIDDMTDHHEFAKWTAGMGIDEKSPGAITLEVGRFEFRGPKKEEMWDSIKSAVDHLPMISKLCFELNSANIDPLLAHLTSSYDSGIGTGALEEWPLPQLQELSIIGDSFTPDCLRALLRARCGPGSGRLPRHLDRLALHFIASLPEDIREEIAQLLGPDNFSYGERKLKVIAHHPGGFPSVAHAEASSNRVSQWSRIKHLLRPS